MGGGGGGTFEIGDFKNAHNYTQHGRPGNGGYLLASYTQKLMPLMKLLAHFVIKSHILVCVLHECTYIQLIKQPGKVCTCVNAVITLG